MTMCRFAGVGCMLLAVPAVAGTPRAPAPPVVDDATDRPAPPSSACSASGALCARVEEGPDGAAVVFTSGRRVEVPVGADRLALDEAGWAAFVAPVGGWPAVYVAAPTGTPRPLTNVGLVRTPGRVPNGFVPPPVREGDLRFEGEALVWPLPDGSLQRLSVPERGHP